MSISWFRRVIELLAGSTTKTVVRLLRVKTEEKREPKMFVFINNKLMETYMAGLEDLIGK